jgi:hypothetical protein
MRTISSLPAHRWAPIGLSGVQLARSSRFSVSGSMAMSASPPASRADSKPSFSR